MSMFCFQCEQTSRGTGCTSHGVCGKDPEVAALQDLIIHQLKGYAFFLDSLLQGGKKVEPELVSVMQDALFYTVTNVNFDSLALEKFIRELQRKKDKVAKLYAEAAFPNSSLPEAATFVPAGTRAELITQAYKISIEQRLTSLGPNIVGLQELLVYGLKGAAAYACHARVFGMKNEAFNRFTAKALAHTTLKEQTINDLLGLCLACGAENLTVMEDLDKAHNEHLGHPEPTQVNVKTKKGRCILVSGHDLHDLQSLLEATKGKGINIYTHGEMLPAHSYPALKKYPHLAGNYGGAWQDQAKEFAAFPGPILMTTNCIQKPMTSYKDRVFTTGLVGWPDVTHVPNGQWGKVIESALTQPGFTEDETPHMILVGFGHHAVLSVADKIIDGVKNGAIRHFFLIGGCDGAKSGRDYYTQLAESVPDDCIILTLACGKYRFNKRDFGTIGGLPRLLDVGQCNDAYSAIKIASALAGAFNTDVNGLPLSMVLSWYEQKAVVVLLSLLHLGIKNIRLGPTLPAFLTPDLLNVLVEKFNIQPIGDVESDLKAMLEK